MQNPAGFLRQDGVPLIQDIARRLEAAQHYTSVQDMLDLPTPMLRVLLWPRPGLLDATSERLLVTLELVLGEVEEDVLAARYWLGSRPVAGEVEHLGTVSTADLTPDWLERQILAFVEKVLERV